MKSLFVTLAHYNRWANERLYAEMAKLHPEALAAPTAANFGSIIAIANHLVLADRLWLYRFTGQGEPVPSADAVPHASLADLTAARIKEEDRAIACVQNLDPDSLSDILHYTTTEGTPRAEPLAICLSHFFNHQTLHRGQIHGLLGNHGIKAADIDLIAYQVQTKSYTG